MPEPVVLPKSAGGRLRRRSAAGPDRYKRFIRAGSSAHTAIGGGLFHTATANGIPLYQWVWAFVNNDSDWVDAVE